MPHRVFHALRWSAWLAFGLLCTAVAAYAFSFLYGQPQADNPLHAKFAASGLDVPAHLFGGGPALLLAPRLDRRRFQVVTLEPLVLGAEDFGLLPGLETLRKFAKLKSINPSVPVNAVLIFTAR